MNWDQQIRSQNTETTVFARLLVKILLLFWEKDSSLGTCASSLYSVANVEKETRTIQNGSPGLG